MSDLDGLTERMRAFTKERDWEQFHDPKSLLLALVGELAELFQWLPADRAAALAGESRLQTRAAEELSDILLYLVRLADVLNVDLAAAANAKLDRAADRFRPEDVLGTAPTKD